MPDHELHYRSFPLELREVADGDGLTVEGVAVPYNVPADITEVRGGRSISYREQFVPGAFERAMRAPTRVALVYDHSDSFGDRLGYATSFRDTDAGLHATFRLDPSRADHARDVLTSSHGGLSVGFYSIIPKIGSEAAGALVTRRSAALVHVACVAQPAHPGARVETIRAALDFGEPTAADIALAEQRRADAELLAFFAAEAGRWNTLQH